MDAFFRTHAYLVEHAEMPIRRQLMDEIDWGARLIGIKGTRGVGKTSFLLQYAKENFNVGDKRCLYINMNNFYFQGRGFFDFAGSFYEQGGRVLLIDQVFKYPLWSKELRHCYDEYPDLKIIFTGSSVMRLKEENPELNGIVQSYDLRGFSFREFLNLKTHKRLRSYTLQEILDNHKHIVADICSEVNPEVFFQDYLHHGYYPFFNERRNYSENLLKKMNMSIEVDILLIKGIELKYLTKIKKLFYLLAIEGRKTPNVSQLATEIETSRATIVNYMKYLADARLTNILYKQEKNISNKPVRVLLQNTNLLYAIYPLTISRQEVLETFFVNSLWKEHQVCQDGKASTFFVDGNLKFRIIEERSEKKVRISSDTISVCATNNASQRHIPIWLFGFLY